MLTCRAILLLVCAACAWSGTVYTFEPSLYSGGSTSSIGTAPTLGGQDGWYDGGSQQNPVSGRVLIYPNNGTLPTAPGGGTQFVAMIGPNASTEHSATFAGASAWAITYDVLIHSFSSQSPIGSFFMFSPGAWQLHAYAAWDYPASGPNTWSAMFDVHHANGSSWMNQDAGTGFHGLQKDHWYQEQIVFNTTSNQILSVSLTDPGDPSAGGTYNPAGWYFAGGASGTFNVSGIGLYSIGEDALLFDNISLDAAPEPATWALLLPGAAALCCLRNRRRTAPARNR